MIDRSTGREHRGTRTLLTLLGGVVVLFLVGAGLVAGLQYLELPEAVEPARIEQLLPAEIALLTDLATQVVEQGDSPLGLLAGLDDGSAERITRIEERMEAWRAIEAQAGPLARPEIVSARVRLWRGSTNRIAIVLVHTESDAVDWELPSFEASPEPGRPAVKLVHSGARRLVRYAAKLGERDGLAYGFDVVFDLERLLALDAAAARPDAGPER
jgi:hypothetical protein